MNYFISNLVRDRMLWSVIALGAVVALNLIDLLFTMFAKSPFHLWVVRGTAGLAAVGGIVFAVFLRKQDKRRGQLQELLPRFLEERRSYLEHCAAEDPGFQTFCHKCLHFDLERLRCLLVLRERKAWIKMSDESPTRHCLYWNLEEQHPVMRLTGKLKSGQPAATPAADERRPAD